METRKILNLLNSSENERLKFATKKWYIIDAEIKAGYSQKNPISFSTSSIESTLWDYSDAYVLVTGNINVVGADDNTKTALKNCAPFRKCTTELNETHIDEAEHLNIAMAMYNLIEYNDNYSDTSGSLWQFKRDKTEEDVDLTVDDNHISNNSSSFKCKSSLPANRNHIKIAVPLKCLSNFWRSLEIPLINCKVELSLTWDPNCVLCTLAGASTFTIPDAKLYVPIVTLSTEDNAKLSKLLSEGFKRPVYWNEYSVIAEKSYNANALKRESIDPSCQGINRLSVLACEGGDDGVTADSHRGYFLPRIEIKNYNMKLKEEIFMTSRLIIKK